MPKEEWGVKRVCPETGKRFYDLNKTPVVSPYTGAVVDVDAETKTNTMLKPKPTPLRPIKKISATSPKMIWSMLMT